jgi:hypothetical protein
MKPRPPLPPECLLGSDGVALIPPFRHGERIAGDRSRFVVKLQPKAVCQQGLKHRQKFGFAGRTIGFGNDVVPDFADPLRTSQNLVLRGFIRIPDASLQADIPHFQKTVTSVFA